MATLPADLRTRIERCNWPGAGEADRRKHYLSVEYQLRHFDGDGWGEYDSFATFDDLLQAYTTSDSTTHAMGVEFWKVEWTPAYYYTDEDGIRRRVEGDWEWIDLDLEYITADEPKLATAQ